MLITIKFNLIGIKTQLVHKVMYANEMNFKDVLGVNYFKNKYYPDGLWTSVIVYDKIRFSSLRHRRISSVSEFQEVNDKIRLLWAFAL